MKDIKFRHHLNPFLKDVDSVRYFEFRGEDVIFLKGKQHNHIHHLIRRHNFELNHEIIRYYRECGASDIQINILISEWNMTKSLASSWRKEKKRYLGGEGELNLMYGHHQSDHTRKKISEHHPDYSGKNNPMAGKKRTKLLQ